MLQPKLISVEPIEQFKLLLKYETGETKLFDVIPYIRGRTKGISLFSYGPSLAGRNWH